MRDGKEQKTGCAKAGQAAEQKEEQRSARGSAERAGKAAERKTEPGQAAVRRTEEKIEQYMRQHNMIQQGCHVIAGVSGGADSVCMLLVLLRLRQKTGYTVSAVHVEHGIRGEAAMADAEFVRHFCAKEGIECHICHCCVPEYAREHGMSEEEAGRQLRYHAFEEEKKKYGSKDVKIAVAHNLSDNAETMLFHLARGTGIRGLAAIAPVRGDIIRPLLCLSRDEIEAYLDCLGQDFCTDATNEADGYSRNKIRHHALPVLSQVNRQAVRHMYQTADQLREISSYLERQAAEALKTCCVIGSESVGRADIAEKTDTETGIGAGIRAEKQDTETDVKAGAGAGNMTAEIDKERFGHMDPVVQKEMLYQLLAELAGSARNFTNEHICQVKDLFARQNGRQVRLPYGLTAVRIYGGVRISAADREEDAAPKADTDLSEQFIFRVIENNASRMSIISKKKYTKSFDYDKIESGICIRTRQPGDYLAVNASGERQKLKKYLINEKIPASERGRLLLLADGAHIMWVVGHRMSSHYKVDEHTRRILIVTFCGGREDEQTD